MSTLKAVNIQHPSSASVNAGTDTSGNFLMNSGYGSVATAYGCRAWVNFNGTGTVAIRASGNVSSITDNGTGDYTVNFSTAMSDANYAWSAVAGKIGARDCFVQPVPDTTPTWSTSAFRFVVWSSTGSAQADVPYVSAMVVR